MGGKNISEKNLHMTPMLAPRRVADLTRRTFRTSQKNYPANIVTKQKNKNF